MPQKCYTDKMINYINLAASEANVNKKKCSTW